MDKIPAPVYLTTSHTVHVGRALLLSALLSGDGAVADAQLYDGQNTNGPQVLHLEAPSGESIPYSPPGGLLFHNGLHAVVNAATSKLTLTYLILPSE